MSLSNTNAILISKNRASQLSLGVVFITSVSLVVYTFSKKNKKS